MSLLEVNSLSVSYGRIPALREVSLAVERGEIVALIGANGAGKTTLLKSISGLLPRNPGSITLEDKPIDRASPPDVVRAGISHVPEGRRIFPEMSVEENLEMGAYARHRGADLAKEMQAIYDLFPVLGERRKGMADSLSGGEQQMLVIGRALMAKPKLLLMDEPSMGLAPKLVKAIFSIISEINANGTTILLVEQNASVALSVSQRAYVIENGKIVMSGASDELATDQRVIDAYLGASVA